jgi:hypothetical protein
MPGCELPVFGYEEWLKLRRPPDWWQSQILLPWKWPFVCTIRVLMVTDGATFGAGNGYNLSRVLEAVQHDLPPYVAVDVTTAQHVRLDSTADMDEFRFDKHDLGQFDQIWMFAVNPGDTLLPGEASAIWKFMQAGGGVFATGDHEALGVGMCGRIPRIRSMRRWYHPGPGPNGEPLAPNRDVGGGRGENDSTTTAAGTDFDGVPQVIAPVERSAPGIAVFIHRKYPHPLLCGKDGRVAVLPDHMHEGLVEVPSDLAAVLSVDGVDVVEYPKRGADRLAPEVVAYSSVNNNPNGGPFGLIGAYDGHLVDEIPGGVGRAVVDATWHHFWNMNVDQFASAHDAIKQAVTAGLPADPTLVAPAQAWEQIRDYFQNIAFWLARTGTRRCIRNRGLIVIGHHVDILMTLRSSDSDRIGFLAGLGAKARDALGAVASQCERIEFAFPQVVKELEVFRPWKDPDPGPRRGQVPLLDASMLDDVLLGAAVETAARASAGLDDDQANELVHSPELEEQLAAAARQAGVALAHRLRADAGRLERLLG